MQIINNFFSVLGRETLATTQSLDGNVNLLALICSVRLVPAVTSKLEILPTIASFGSLTRLFTDTLLLTPNSYPETVNINAEL